MKSEWTELKTLQEVASAQSNDWEIQVTHVVKDWVTWLGVRWYADAKYRGRPKQPKMKQVKMLCWYKPGQRLIWDEFDMTRAGWSRVPAEDKVFEVPEC